MFSWFKSAGEGKVTVGLGIFAAALILAQAAWKEDVVRLPLVDTVADFLKKKPA
mgnify:CR=1 FL=1